MLVVVQEQERDPPGRRLPRLLIANSKGRLFRIAPDEEQRLGFASGASWSYSGASRYTRKRAWRPPCVERSFRIKTAGVRRASGRGVPLRRSGRSWLNARDGTWA
jgi:hypothetical protein